jgi:hypothetical protein
MTDAARRIRPSICRGWLLVDGVRSGKISLWLQGYCGRGQTRRGRGWVGAVCFGPLLSLCHVWLSWPFVGRPLAGHDEEAADAGLLVRRRPMLLYILPQEHTPTVLLLCERGEGTCTGRRRCDWLGSQIRVGQNGLVGWVRRTRGW